MPRLVVLLLVLLRTANCAAASQAPCPDAAVEAEWRSAFQGVLDDLIRRNPGVPGVLLHVEAPDTCISWSGASGVTSRAAPEPLRVDQPFRIASNTKTYTAAAIFRLVERGKLNLGDPIAGHLPPEIRRLLESGGFDLERVTLRHLLTHTSGLPDHTRSPEYVAAVMANPQERWSRADQIRFAVDRAEAAATPFERFRYNDSGYVLLGGIVEKKTGNNMAAAFRELLNFDGLGLSETWLETLEPQPEGVADRAHQYLGDVDTYAFDPSMDLWGGGGIAATSRDLALFLLYLMEGRVLEKKETLHQLLSVEVSPTQGGYRAGIHRMTHGGLTGWGHTGFWNTFAVYFPEARISIAGSINQQQGPRRDALIEPVLEILRKR